jgi:SAM-dependent methyltransferase
MTDEIRMFAGGIPENYDRFLRPLLFEPYAADLASRLEIRPGMRVLELACGTGVLTERVSKRLDPASSLLATDLNEGMLAVARARYPSDRVEWRLADAMQLPFPDASFDAIVCQFGWMFFPDKPHAFRESRRVLSDGGSLLFNVWESLARNRLALAAQETAAAAIGAPLSFFDTPYGYHDRRQITADLEAGGFSHVTIKPLEIEGCSPSARDAATALIEGSPLANQIAKHGPAALARARDAVIAAYEKEYGAGPVRTELNALVCSGLAA